MKKILLLSILVAMLPVQAIAFATTTATFVTSTSANIQPNKINGIDPALLIPSTGTSTIQGVVSIDAGSNTVSPAAWFEVGSSTPNLYVDKNSGNVGISTSSPSAKLSVGMASTTASLYVGALGSTTPALYVGSANMNGFVGINTSNPQAQLDVALPPSTAPAGLRASRTGTPSQYIQMDISDGSANRIFSTGGQKALQITNLSNAVGSGTNSDGIILTVPGATANTGAIALTLLSVSGNAGFGTSTPGFPLSVSKAGTADLDALALVNNQGGANDKANIHFYDGGGTGGTIGYERQSSASGDFTFDVSPTFSGTLAEAMRITQAGKVGVGTSSPMATLSVVGTTYLQPLGSADTGLTVNTAAGINVIRTLGNGNPRVIIGQGTPDSGTNFEIHGASGNGTTTSIYTVSSNKALAIIGASGQTADLLNINSINGINGNLLNVTAAGFTGIGTSTPYAKLSVQSNIGTINTDAFAVATSSGAAVFGVDNDGHSWTSGPAGAITSCGTGTGTVVGDDQTGVITTATAATACTLTFSKAYRNSPVCNVTDDSLVGFADISSVSASAVTFGISSALTGGYLYYSCRYHQ